jgi:DNA helicase-2/ATP-dependent DNA helicase PcrA
MALVSDQDNIEEEQEKSVTMMTLHVSKGLEYPIVYIVGLEEGLFPSARSADENGDLTAMEEERRLMYVGMTRAEKKLTLTYARTRKVWGSEQQNAPSRFLKELPGQGVVRQSNSQRPKFIDRMRDTSHDDFDSQGWDSGGSYGAHRAHGSTHGSAKKKHPLMENDFGGMPSYEDFGDEGFDEESSTGPALKKGMRVRHPSYGVGQILSTEGSGAELKVSVVFGDNTVKKFVAKYARLERV